MVMASERKLAFALVQEPYVGGIGRMKEYRGARVYQCATVGGGTVKAAIVAFNSELDVTLCPKLTNNNMVVVRIRTCAWEIVAVSFYFEPDQPLGPYLEQLREVAEELGPRGLLIGGDSNAKSTWWGSTIEDSRGVEMSGTLEELGLQILNRGDTPTFNTVRGTRVYTSLVDITASTDDLLELIDNWRVDQDMVSSDHSAILFDVNLQKSKGMKVQRTTRKYNTRKANWDIFRETLVHKKREFNINKQTIESISDQTRLETLINNLNTVIKTACDEAIPAKNTTEILRIPWWSEELATLRKAMRSLKDSATERAVDFVEAPHPAEHMRLEFACLGDQNLVDRHNVQTANLQRKRLAISELYIEAGKRRTALALVQEPYTNNTGKLRDIRAARTYQRTTQEEGTVKAAVIVFDASLEVEQHPELTTNNIVVVRIRFGTWWVTVVSLYFEPSVPLDRVVLPEQEDISSTEIDPGYRGENHLNKNRKQNEEIAKTCKQLFPGPYPGNYGSTPPVYAHR
ncbi:hypothetical protein ACJJTC_000044 [Scirpophaga incertulas]